MQRVFRTMKREGAFPACGDGADMLGVRPGPDVKLDEQGRVLPGEGMSVAPAWKLMPHFRIPARLRSIPGAEHASGNSARCVWHTGDEPFTSGPFADCLDLRVTSATHGQIEPSCVMPLEGLQSALAATRERWRLIEEDPGCSHGMKDQ